MSKYETPDPTPLLKPLPSAAEVPLADLGPLADPIEAISFLTGAPPGLALQAVLGTMSAAAQGHADVETIHGVSPTSLFLLTIAKSGERKSACDKLATKPMREFEGPRMRQFRKDSEAFEQAESRHSRNLSAVIEPCDTSDFGNVPASPPVNPKIMFEDITLPGLTKHFETGQPSIAIFSDEGGTFLGGHSMKDVNRINSATCLSRLWDGKAIDRVRAGEPSITLPNRRAAMHLAVQPRIGLQFLADEDVLDQGLTCRFLISFPESKVGTRLIDKSPAAQEKRQWADRAVQEFYHRIKALLEKPFALADGDARELSLSTLKLSVEARGQLEDFYNATEYQSAPGRRYANISGTATKAPEQAARIAGVLMLFHEPDATTVSGCMMQAAIALTDFYLGEALRLLDTGSISREIQDAELLRGWLCETWPEELIDPSTAARRGPNSLREVRKLKKLFRILEEHGWLQELSGAHFVDGRKTRQAWQVIRP